MIGSISSLAAQAGGTVSIKAASETAQVFNTSKNQWAPSPQGVESLKFSTLVQQLSASASRAEDRDFNYRTHLAEGRGKHPRSLIEMLFEMSPQEANEFAKMAKNKTGA